MVGFCTRTVTSTRSEPAPVPVVLCTLKVSEGSVMVTAGAVTLAVVASCVNEALAASVASMCASATFSTSVTSSHAMVSAVVPFVSASTTFVSVHSTV